jgi:hypothetical protein
MADSLLEILMAETKRLISEKVHAVHAVAMALLEHGELIGPELEEVFREADARHPEAAAKFERRLVTLPKLFEQPAAGGDAWPAEKTETAAAIIWRTATQPESTTS